MDLGLTIVGSKLSTPTTPPFGGSFPKPETFHDQERCVNQARTPGSNNYGYEQYNRSCLHLTRLMVAAESNRNKKRKRRESKCQCKTCTLLC